MTVYHYTDTYRLPRILVNREFRPRRFTFNQPPIDDFLWATTSTRPEPTSRAVEHYVEHYRAGYHYLAGGSRLVRFTLPSEGFVPFDEQAILNHWGSEYLYVLDNEIRSFGWLLVKTWRVRVGPLPLKRVTGIEILARCGRWDPLTAGEKKRMIHEGFDEILADAHYSKKDEEDDYEGYEGFE